MALEVQSHAGSGAAIHNDAVQQALDSLKGINLSNEVHQSLTSASSTSSFQKGNIAESVGGATAAKIAPDGSIDFSPTGIFTSFGNDAKLFGEGVVTGAALNPINALGQLSNHMLGTDFGPLQFSNQDEVNNSMAGKIGEFAGTAADFVGLTIATGGLGDAAGIGLGAMNSAGIAGAVEGGLLTPTSDSNFVGGRLLNMGVGMIAGSLGIAGGEAVGAITEGVSGAAAQAAVKVAGSSVVGGALGAGTAEASSLLATGQFASVDQLTMAVAAGAAAGAIGGLSESARGGSSDSNVTKSSEAESSAVADPTKLAARGITDENTLRSGIAKTLQQAHDKDVSISIDATKQVTDAAGNPTKATQGSILYDELAKAYPDRSFTFTKPEYNPGDPEYTEVPGPLVEKDGFISTKENPVTVKNSFSLSDGTTVPEGSKLAVGTMYDGTSVKSIDPAGKVWATTPDGKFLQVADAGESATLPKNTVSTAEGETGQVANKMVKDDDGSLHENHIIVRTAKAIDPDGKPLLDSFPTSGAGFKASYKEGTQPGYYAPRGKVEDHFMLPDNVTVEAETQYGHSTASGTKGDYYMRGGFADAADATAKNYTGRTDPRSAAELIRLRGALEMTGPTQAEAGLAEYNSTRIQ